MTQRPGPFEDNRLQDSIAHVHMLAERGQHEEAKELCQGLIRDRPDSGPAHAAMGDVCAAEGRWNEAIDWYELALNLNFDPAVMEKLAVARSRAIRAGAGEAQPAAPPAPTETAPEERGLSRQVVGIVIIGVLLVTILAFFLARGLSRPSERTTTVDTSQPDGGPAMPGQPPPYAPDRTPAQAPGRSPVVMPSAPPPLPPTPAQQPAATPQPRPQPTPRPERRAVSAEPTSSRERRVLDGLHFMRLQSTGSARLPAAMAFDDYSGVGILTFRIHLPDNHAGLEQELATAAFRAALAAMRTDPDLKTLVVRYVTSIPGGEDGDEDVVIFRATALRDRLQPWMNRPDTPDPRQLRTEVLMDVWLDHAALERHTRGRDAARSDARAAPPR